MAETFCDSAAVKLKAGVNVSSSLTPTHYTQLINQAECAVNTEVSLDSIDLVDEYSSLNDNVKKILEDAASSHAAMGAASYDPDGYTNTAQFQTVLDFNLNRWSEAIRKLKDKNIVNYLRTLT